MTDFYTAAPGETSPPVPAGPALCNGTDMRIVHNAFLWGYEQAPGLIRSTPAGDTDRAGFIGQWVGDLDATLHVHHHSEDELLWERLEQRAPACALHVAQMRAHHAKVAELLDAISPVRAEWRATGDAAQGETLARAYEDLLAVLRVHLRREVVEIVPVAEKVLTQKEWDQLAEHSMGVIPKSRLLPQLGMLLANASPADRAEFVRAIPTPIRILYKTVGRRQFAHQYQQLFPGKPVPATI